MCIVDNRGEGRAIVIAQTTSIFQDLEGFGLRV